ncbi:MAG: ATPase involved in chromosome partitioning-like protein [Rubritepida sp.]|nr:ATPase involved in chromosome partitioning-like protein [Rubritepida sp.]
MTVPVPRAHLVERAIEAMAGFSANDRRMADTAEMPRPVLHPQPAPAARPPAITMARLQEAGLSFAVDASPRSKIMEELALIQHQLLRVAEPVAGEPKSSRRQIMMVTSARQGEGKSFTSLNLAASIAGTTSLPVVLMDMDGGGSSLSRRLGVMAERGILGLAADPSMHKDALLLPTAIERLFFLPHGKLMSGQAGSPNADALAAAVRSVAAALPRHVLILDTPPALSTSDAQALSAIVGQVIMVVRAESTQRDEVEAALDLVEACPALHLLLNRTRLATNDSFGAHGEYGAATHA